MLGLGVTVFAMVGLESQAENDLQAFEKRVADWPEVLECHMLNGEIDFILKCIAPDLESFQEFLTKKLTPAPNVANVRTSLTIRRSKGRTALPIGDVGLRTVAYIRPKIDIYVVVIGRYGLF